MEKKVRNLEFSKKNSIFELEQLIAGTFNPIKLHIF